MIFKFLGLGPKPPKNPEIQKNEIQENLESDPQSQGSRLAEKMLDAYAAKAEIAWDKIAVEAPQIAQIEPIAQQEIKAEAIIEEVEVFKEPPALKEVPVVVPAKIGADEQNAPLQSAITHSADSQNLPDAASSLEPENAILEQNEPEAIIEGVEAFVERPVPENPPEVVASKIEFTEEKISVESAQSPSVDVESSTDSVSPPQLPDAVVPDADFKTKVIAQQVGISEASTKTPITQMSGMNCAPEDVIAAYKIFLGRLPENMQVIQPWVGAPSEKLLIDFMVSNEFLSNPDRVKFVVNLAKKIIEAHAATTANAEGGATKTQDAELVSGSGDQ